LVNEQNIYEPVKQHTLLRTQQRPWCGVCSSRRGVLLSERTVCTVQTNSQSTDMTYHVHGINYSDLQRICITT